MSVRKPKARRRTSVMTYVWMVVLGLSSIALFAGFASGSASVASPQVRVAKNTAAIPAAEVPDRVPLVRTLHGAHSLAIAGEAPRADVDDAVDVDQSRHASPNTPARLAIVILDAQAGDSVVNQLLELPLPLTFSVDPTVDGARDLATRAHAIGHGLLVQLPGAIGPQDAANPIDVAHASTAARAQGVLRAAIAQVPGATGVDVANAPFADLSPGVARALAGAFVHSGMTYVALRTPSDDRVARAARAQQAPIAVRDVVIDAHDDEAYVRFMLREAAELSFRYGNVIALAHPYPETYAALRALGGRLAADGVEFTSITDIIR